MIPFTDKGRVQDNYADLDALRQLAKDEAPSIGQILFGEHGKKEGNCLRFENRKVSIVIQGEKRGLYCDYVSCKGGDMFALIGRQTGADFHGQVDWMRKYWGGKMPQTPARVRQNQIDNDAARATEIKKLRDVEALIHESVPIAGTPAETYLQSRNIEAEHWPDCVRFNAAKECAVFISTLADGRATAIQRVFISACGVPIFNIDGKKDKRSLGEMLGGAVKFPGPPEMPLIVCEGPETAAAIWTATGYETWAMLGPISKRLDLSKEKLDRVIMVASDDDAITPISLTIKTLRATIKQWGQEGRRVVEVTPWAERRQDKSDFADVILTGGKAAIRKRFAAYTDEVAIEDSRRNKMPIAQAREQLAGMIASTDDALAALPWDSAGDVPPPAALIVASGGMGKTEMAIRQSLKNISKGIKPIAFATPTHELNAELLERSRNQAKKHGIDVTIEMRLGREALIPGGNGMETMCKELEAVREVTAAGLDVQSTLCETKLPGGESARCSSFAGCAYQAQKQKKADLWLVSHSALGHPRPSEVGQPARLIIDEDPIKAMLRGQDNWITIAAYEIGSDIGRSVSVEADNQVLLKVRAALRAMLETEQRHITRTELNEAGISAEMLKEAAGQALGLISHPKGLFAGMTPTERRKRLEPTAENRCRLRERELYRLLREFMERKDGAEVCGTVHVVKYKRPHQDAEETLFRLMHLAKISKGWAAPTMLLDATARPDYRIITRELFPGLIDEIGGTIEATTPGVKITAVTGRKISKQALRASKGGKLARHVLAFTNARAIEHGGEALLIGNKALADEIEAML